MKRGGENIFSLPFFVAMLIDTVDFHYRRTLSAGVAALYSDQQQNITDPFKRKSAANICFKEYKLYI